MAWCPPTDPDSTKAFVPWIRDPDGRADKLSTDAAGNLCVKVSDGTTTSCQTNFRLVTLPTADTEVALTSFLTGLSGILRINLYNTKVGSRDNPIRIATTSGLVATPTEPYLDLGWGCVYELECGTVTDLYLASSFAGHTLILEVITAV